jgi:hypothetical protein
MRQYRRKIEKGKKKISIADVEITDNGIPYSTSLKFAGIDLSELYIITALDYHVDVQDGCKGTITISYYKRKVK